MNLVKEKDKKVIRIIDCITIYFNTCAFNLHIRLIMRFTVINLLYSFSKSFANPIKSLLFIIYVIAYRNPSL